MFCQFRSFAQPATIDPILMQTPTACINRIHLYCMYSQLDLKHFHETEPWKLQTLESDSFICIREQKEGSTQPEVIIVDLKNNNNVVRRAIKADSAIMHWTKQIIALKANTSGSRTLQIFDLGEKKKLKSATMTDDVLFWKWFSETSLGLVTENAVYHWNVFDPSEASPVEVFKRNPNLTVS